jgi:hypothetical protein
MKQQAYFCHSYYHDSIAIGDEWIKPAQTFWHYPTIFSQNIFFRKCFYFPITFLPNCFKYIWFKLPLYIVKGRNKNTFYLYKPKYIYPIQCIVFYAFHLMHFIICIIFYVLYSMYCILCIVLLSALYSMHFMSCIKCYALYFMHCNICIVLFAL